MQTATLTGNCLKYTYDISENTKKLLNLHHTIIQY
nr:MAG TPA: hypothetical protein [Caudoviricetes sp.]